MRHAANPRLAALALVGSNLVPLVGVLAFGWSVNTLLVLYWLESGVVGAASVAKIRRAAGRDDPGRLPSFSLNDRPLASFANDDPGAVARFFVGHYGVFWAVHGAFVGAFAFGAFAGLSPPDPVAAALGVVGFAASHAYSYRANYLGAGEYERTGPATLMVEPYRRVVVLHLTIVLGAFAVAWVGAPVGALAVLVGVKTLVDLWAHRREHDRARSRPRTPGEWGETTPGERPERGQ